VSRTSDRTDRHGAIRGNVLAMGWVSLLTDLSSEMINPLLPIFIAGLVPLGMAPVYVGLMEGVAQMTASLLQLVSGRVSDRLGKRKPLVALGYLLSMLFRPAMALAGFGWQVVALKFGDRVGKGLRTSPRDALIGDSVGAKSRGLAFSFHRAMDHTGAVLGPLVAMGILYLLLGRALWRGSAELPDGKEMQALRWLFGLALIPGLFAMLTLALKVREIAPRRAETKMGHGAKLPRKFYAFVGVVTLFALGNSSDLFLLLYAKTQFGMSLLAMIGLWVALHISKIIFSLPSGMLSDRIGRRPLIIGGWLVYALVYLGLAFAQTQWQLGALFILYGAYFGMCEGVEKAVVADLVPSDSRATAFGIYHAAIGIATLPASLLFGIFWSQIGAAWAFGIGAGLAGLAAVLMMAVLRTAKPAEKAV
jgi:MFS family permease